MTQTESRPLAVNGSHPNGNGHTNGNGKATKPARVPPHNLEAERSLLGSMLLSRDAIAAGEETVTAGDFYKPGHAHIYDTILNLYTRGEPSDPVTVFDELTRNGLIEAAGGLQTLIDLQADTPAASNAGRYARIVADHSLLRRLIGAAGEITELGYSTPDDVTSALDQAEQLLYRISDQRQQVRAVRIGDSLPTWVELLERRRDHGISGVTSGLIDLDEHLTGFHPGELITVAARPGMGKSLLGAQWAVNVADAHAVPSLVFSVEMGLTEVIDRMVSSAGRINHQNIRTGQLHEVEWPRLSDALVRLTDLPLYVHDIGEATLVTIRAEMRRVSSIAGKIGLIVVDYLQLLTATSQRENRQVEVSEISRGLKRIARELDVPVVALAQLNRNLEARADKRPNLADLRESGAVENDSDVVIFIYRDDYYKPDSADRGTAELIVAKQRNGPTGTARVDYLAHYGIFANMARV